MNFNPLFTLLLGIFLITWTCSNVLGPSRADLDQQIQQNSTFVTTVSDEQAADGLDLKALPAILQEVKNAKEFETKLNEPNGVNNLDLNNDGVVDYINVEEISDSEKEIYGFVLSTEVESGEIQEIASIEVEKKGEKVDVTTHGNQGVYGSGSSYHSSFPFGTFFLMSYFLSPHSFFSSPYGYGSYPSSYRPYNNVSSSDYKSRASRFQQKSPSTKTTSSANLKTPNKNANSGIKKSLRNPTSSQKSFRNRELNRAAKSGGFGKSSSKSSSSFFGRSSSRVRSFSSSSRGFGGFGK